MQATAHALAQRAQVNHANLAHFHPRPLAYLPLHQCKPPTASPTLIYHRCESSDSKRDGPRTITASHYHSQIGVAVPPYELLTSWTRDLRRFDNVVTALWVLDIIYMYAYKIHACMSDVHIIPYHSFALAHAVHANLGRVMSKVFGSRWLLWSCGVTSCSQPRMQPSRSSSQSARPTST
eukprot:1146520-Pelagomonas_calceolata.AAC.6